MQEMLDTYDINGNFVGVKSKSFCHSRYKITENDATNKKLFCKFPSK